MTGTTVNIPDISNNPFPVTTNPNGRFAAADSKSVAQCTEDKAVLDAVNTNTAATVTAEAASARIYLQLGAFGDRANADRVASAARKGGIDQVDVAAADVNGRTVHRVRVGPLADVAAADALSPRIERLGFGVPRVAIER